jgi:hypothetical protein
VAADGDAGALTGAEPAGALAGADEPAAGDATGDSPTAPGDVTGEATGEDAGAGGGAVGRKVPTTAAPCTGTSSPLTDPLLPNDKPITTESPCVSGAVRLRRRMLILAVPGPAAVAAGTITSLALCSDSAAGGTEAVLESALAGRLAAVSGSAVTLTSPSAWLAKLIASNCRYARPPLGDVMPLGSAMMTPWTSRLLPIFAVAACRLATAWRTGDPKPVAEHAARIGAHNPTTMAVRTRRRVKRWALVLTWVLLTTCPLRLPVCAVA